MAATTPTRITPLRQRMLDALQLRGMAPRTQETYIDAVSRLARHYHRSPELLSADEVQAYLLHLLRDRHLARASVNLYGCAFRFLYRTVLALDGEVFQIPLGPAPQALPEVLAREELARLFDAACHAKARSFLQLAYGTGLRVSELCHLRVEHIDSHADRMCLHVVQGKGAKDRFVPLSPDTLAVARAWWQVRAAPWLAVRHAARRRSAPGHRHGPALVPPGLRARRHHQTRRHPHPAPLLRHPPARSRGRPAQPAAVAGP